MSRQLLAELARRAPLLPGREQLAFVDIDAMQKRVYGQRKQGAAFGHTKIQGKSLLVRGLNALAATICTPLGVPVIAATRLCGGNANSARGAARFAAEAIAAARDTGCTGLIIVRADSSYYSAAFCGAVRRAAALFSVTVNMDPKVAAALRLRRLPLEAGGSAQEPEQPGRLGGREVAPVRTGNGHAQRAGIEGRRPRGGHEPVKAHRRERKDARQHLLEALDLLPHRGGLLLRGPLLRFEKLLLAGLLPIPFLLSAFPRQPFGFLALRGQAVLPIGSITAAGHVCCAPDRRAYWSIFHAQRRLGG